MEPNVEQHILDIWYRVEPDAPVSWIAEALGLRPDDVRRVIVRSWLRRT